MLAFRLAAFGGPLDRHRGPIPVPQGTEVLVRVMGAGICHSDLHIQDGHVDFGPGARLSFADRIALPVTLGHETAGTVAALGPDAEGVAEGAAVLVNFLVGCGTCPACAGGDEHHCASPRYLGIDRDGGYAEWLLVPHPRYLVDLGSLDPVAAAPLACAGLTAYSALRKVGTAPESRRLVLIGAGGLGMMAISLMAKMAMVAPVVVEIDAGRRRAAEAAGACLAVDPRVPGVLDQIRAAVGAPVLEVVDFVGAAETAQLALDLLGKGGRLVVVGAYGGEVRLPVARIASRTLTIQGSFAGSRDELRALVALVRAGGLPDLPLVRRPLDQADAALGDLRAGRVVGRIVLEP